MRMLTLHPGAGTVHSLQDPGVSRPAEFTAHRWRFRPFEGAEEFTQGADARPGVVVTERGEIGDLVVIGAGEDRDLIGDGAASKRVHQSLPS
jgi:hypothetical protein